MTSQPAGESLRVLALHNSYKEQGGEDVVFAREVELLRARGHRVETYAVHNEETDQWSALARVLRPLWNSEHYHAIDQRLNDFRADVVHVHNFYAVLSPSVYYAARKHGAAVVQTLHNYRLGCASAGFYRDNHVCTDCIGKAVPWPSVLHACYRQSRGASLSVATMTTLHGALSTWRSKVDAYIALTHFSRDLMVKAGLPGERVYVKPNFSPERPASAPRAARRRGALFVGRLSTEKGVELLLAAWERLAIPLRIIGDGPLMAKLPRDNPMIEVLGSCSATEVARAMEESALLIMPAIWYEPFGLVVVEAFANRLPVLAARIGGLPELIDDGVNGLLFEPGDVESMIAKTRWAFDHLEMLPQMGENAYSTYRALYTPDVNYPQLMSIYRYAIDRRRGLDVCPPKMPDQR
jgi:glycosyltransferase involved in cell wall biosynthesis